MQQLKMVKLQMCLIAKCRMCYTHSQHVMIGSGLVIRAKIRIWHSCL